MVMGQEVPDIVVAASRFARSQSSPPVLPKSFRLHIPDLRAVGASSAPFVIFWIERPRLPWEIGCHLEDRCRVRDYGAIGRDELDYEFGLAAPVTG